MGAGVSFEVKVQERGSDVEHGAQRRGDAGEEAKTWGQRCGNRQAGQEGGRRVQLEEELGKVSQVKC